MHPLLLLFLFVCPVFAGTATKARSLVREYDLSFKNWVAKVQSAKGKDAQIAAWNVQPDPDNTGRLLWREIRNNLNESWTLEYAAWLYQNSPAVVAASGPNQKPASSRIRAAVERFHLKSPRVAPVCVAIPELKNPADLHLLKKVETQNPDPRIQGAAAMGQAMLLRHIGDDWKIIRQRREKLKKAIILGNDLPVGKNTVLGLAQDEIFMMNNLEPETVAPDVRGVDISAKPFALSDYEGQVVVLAFWHTWMPEANRSIKILRKLHERLQGENAVVLGVNQDHALTLRRMTGDGETPWRNFSDSSRKIAKDYRVTDWPKVYVLDSDRKIKYVGAPGAFVDITVDALLMK